MQVSPDSLLYNTLVNTVVKERFLPPDAILKLSATCTLLRRGVIDKARLASQIRSEMRRRCACIQVKVAGATPPPAARGDTAPLKMVEKQVVPPPHITAAPLVLYPYNNENVVIAAPFCSDGAAMGARERRHLEISEIAPSPSGCAAAVVVRELFLPNGDDGEDEFGAPEVLMLEGLTLETLSSTPYFLRALASIAPDVGVRSAEFELVLSNMDEAPILATLSRTQPDFLLTNETPGFEKAFSGIAVARSGGGNDVVSFSVSSAGVCVQRGKFGAHKGVLTVASDGMRLMRGHSTLLDVGLAVTFEVRGQGHDELAVSLRRKAGYTAGLDLA